jgi:hypothetical protein
MKHFRYLVGLLGREIGLSQSLYLNRTAQTQGKSRHKSMPLMGFEPTIAAFEESKRVSISQCAAVITLLIALNAFLVISRLEFATRIHRTRAEFELCNIFITLEGTVNIILCIMFAPLKRYVTFCYLLAIKLFYPLFTIHRMYIGKCT